MKKFREYKENDLLLVRDENPQFVPGKDALVSWIEIFSPKWESNATDPAGNRYIPLNMARFYLQEKT